MEALISIAAANPEERPAVLSLFYILKCIVERMPSDGTVDRPFDLGLEHILPRDKSKHPQVITWLRAAGLKLAQDKYGNWIARFEPNGASELKFE